MIIIIRTVLLSHSSFHSMSSRRPRDAATYSVAATTSLVRMWSYRPFGFRPNPRIGSGAACPTCGCFSAWKRTLSASFHSPTRLVFRLDLDWDSLWFVSAIFIHDSASSEVFLSRRRLPRPTFSRLFIQTTQCFEAAVSISTVHCFCAWMLFSRKTSIQPRDPEAPPGEQLM